MEAKNSSRLEGRLWECVLERALNCEDERRAAAQIARY